MSGNGAVNGTLEQAESPPEQAVGVPSPLNGVVAPVHSRWKAGQSGNPRGRALTSAVEEIMDKRPDRVRNAADRWLASVEEGDSKARQQLLDRTEGAIPRENKNELTITAVIWSNEDTDSP